MNYVRNAWYVAGWGKDLGRDKPQSMMILEEPIVLWRDEGGKARALEDRCVHRNAPLSLGRCEGANLRCMYHGFLFNGEGHVVEIPGQADIPSIARVKNYALVEQDSWLWVWMGKQDLADPALIPRVKGLDDPNWVPGYGTLDYEAEASLLNDNLTDLSHLPFVHGQSFAATDEMAATLPTVSLIDRGVRIERWAERQPPLGLPNAPERFDAFLGYDYLVPGIFSLQARAFPVGTCQRLNGAPPPDDLPGMDTWSSQAATPMSKGKTRYFFSNGPGAPAPQEISDFLWQVTLDAFAEDRVMIEGQQRIMDMRPDSKIMPAAGDKGTVLFNRLVNRMIREERQDDKVG